MLTAGDVKVHIGHVHIFVSVSTGIIIWCRANSSVTLSGWKGNRRSGIRLASGVV